MPDPRKRNLNQSNFQDRIKYLQEQDLKKFLKIIRDFEHKLIIKMLLNLGCRVGELVEIKVQDVDISYGTVRIYGTYSKSKFPRTSVIIDKDLLVDLDYYIKSKSLNERDTVFPIGKRRIQQIIKKYGQKIGIPWLTPHKLRHTHICQNLMRGVPINAVQQQVGHKNLSTTQIYSKLSVFDIKKAYLSQNETQKP